MIKESKWRPLCYNSLNNLLKEHTVELLWIPGHNGIRGNEIVDDLVKMGAEQLLMGPTTAVRISYA